MSTRCRRQERELCRYLDQELPLEAALRFEEHAQSCASCRRRLAHHALLEQSLLELPRPVLTVEDRARLLPRAAPVSPRRRPGRLVVPLAAAALLGVGLLLSRALREAGPPEAGPRPATLASVPQPRPEPAPPAAELSSEDWSEAYESASAFRRQVKGELAAILRDMPPGDPFSRELWTELLSIARSDYQLAQACESLLKCRDGNVAENAARLLGNVAARSGTLPGTVVGSLQGMLDEKVHAAAALAALVRVPAPAATRVLTSAAGDPELRGLALLALAERSTPDVPAVLEETLRRLATSAEPADGKLLEEMLGRLRLPAANGVPLLAEVLHAGAPREAVAAALARLGSEGTAVLEAKLSSQQDARSGAMDRFLALAGASGNAAFLEPLARHAARGNATALEALARSGSPEALVTLFSLASSETLSQSRRSAGREAAWNLLASTAPESGLLVQSVLLLDAGDGHALLELCAEGPAVVAQPCLLDVAEDRSAPLDERIAASLLFAGIASETEVSSLIALLEQEWRSLDADAAPMLCSVLVSLYRLDQKDGLRRGLDALGVALDRKHEARLTQLARAALDERTLSSGFASRLRDMEECLPAAP